MRGFQVRILPCVGEYGGPGVEGKSREEPCGAYAFGAKKVVGPTT